MTTIFFANSAPINVKKKISAVEVVDKTEIAVPVTYAVQGNVTVMPNLTNNKTISCERDINEYGGSLYFNGANDYITVSSNGPFSPFTSNYSNTIILSGGQYVTSSVNAAALTFTGDFTIEAFVKPTISSAQGAMAIMTASAAGGDSWTLYLNSGGAGTPWQFGYRINATQIAYADPTTNPVSNNAWNHVVFMRINGFTRMFINGVVDSAAIYTTAGTVTPSTTALRIGASHSATIYFTGQMSNIRINNTTALYPNTGFSVPSIPLPYVSGTTLLITNNMYTDLTGSFATLTPTNVPTTSFQQVTVAPGSFEATETVDAWIYPVTNTGNATIVDLKIANTGGLGYFNLYLNDGILTYNYDGNNVITGPTLGKNTWTHVAITKDSSNVYLYANGTLANTIAFSNVFANVSSTLYIGASQQDGIGNYFNGYISNFRIANTVLTPPAGGPLYPTLSETASFLIGKDTLSSSLSGKFANGYLTRSYNLTTGAFAFGTGDFTVEAFVKMQTMPTSDTLGTAFLAPIVSAANVTATQFCFGVGKTKLYVSNNSTHVISGTNHNMVANVWYHVAATRQANVIYYFVNGVAAGSNSTYITTIPAAAISNTYVGFDRLLNTGSTFNGLISNLRVTRGTAIYSGSTYTVPIQPLTYYNAANAANNILLFTDSSDNLLYNSYDTTSYVVLGTGNFAISALNPFSLAVTYDSSQNNRITFSRSNTAQMYNFNPFNTYGTANTVIDNEIVITTNSDIITYNNTNILMRESSIIETPRKYNASVQQYVTTNTQTVYVATTVTPTSNVGGVLTQFESWV